jgi:hypothetical protein
MTSLFRGCVRASCVYDIDNRGRIVGQTTMETPPDPAALLLEASNGSPATRPAYGTRRRELNFTSPSGPLTALLHMWARGTDGLAHLERDPREDGRNFWPGSGI